MRHNLEILGYVKKEETVHLLKQHIMKGSFVIEINHPFGGYYSWMEGPEGQLDASKPRSILLITKKIYSLEEILRNSKIINKIIDFELSARPAEILYGNKTLPAIRIKGLPSLSDLAIVQSSFSDEGYLFAKAPKNFDNETIRIKLTKFFSLDQTSPGIYRDLRQPEMSYLAVSKQTNWELFRRITSHVKNNVSDQIFDVVQACFYKDRSIWDMLRIYKPGASEEFLLELKNSFNKQLAFFS